MTDQRSPLENALDLLVYAPVGLALTVAEELPKLAAKGRAQVQGQVTIARMVGQFAVAQGRKEIEKRRVGTARPRAPAKGAGPSPGERERPETISATPPAARTGGDGSYERMAGRSGASEPAAEPGATASPRTDGAVIDVDFGAGAASAPPAEGLAIPGYDSLSASQVVQRLAGLSQEELAAVGEYEAAHRGRRTILTRVGQLKG